MVRKKRNVLLLLVVVAVLYGLARQQGIPLSDLFSPTQQDYSQTSLQRAFAEKRSDLQVQGEGVVKRLLADDRKGSQHQKFILEVAPGQTVLVAHNIDVAARLSELRKGDTVQFYGEYEWNSRGGVVHWTHRDRSGRHINGWLKHNGKTYQ